MVDDDQLHVRCGPFSWTIDRYSITSMEDSRNPLSSPALSLDRLEIKYGEGKRILLSPVDKEAFRQSLAD